MREDGATIIALSSGSPPAAIGVVRISGDKAGWALTQLCGTTPPERRASLRTIRHPETGDVLDQALLLWFPGPRTATGEDLAEIHLHGGRAVVAAVLDTLAGMNGLRRAEAGEFTRRAFANGVIDLAQAEGLADLLSAETESQRRNAQLLTGGALSRKVADWEQRLLGLSARVEAAIEFGDDEDDVGDDPAIRQDLAELAGDIARDLARPSAEHLKDGIRVVLAGPPNAGKSTLLNALVEREAAITSPIAGTTRDLIQVPVAIAGVPYVFVDTAGLRDAAADQVESRGVELAYSAVAAADIVLWLGEPDAAPDHDRLILIHPRCDLPERHLPRSTIALAVSAQTGVGMSELVTRLVTMSSHLVPSGSEIALNQRQRGALSESVEYLSNGVQSPDPVICAEELRAARVALDRVTGRAGTEEMLGALFGRFCIGK
jgi:tRNA modification GTPase